MPRLRIWGERIEPGRLDVIFDLTEIEIDTVWVRARVRISIPSTIHVHHKG